VEFFFPWPVTRISTIGDDFARKELEKAIDLLEQDTPYRFRLVTPPAGYGPPG
jgi:hypothetical protein